MARVRPRVFTIPASVPFLPTLLTAFAEGRLVPGFSAAGDPLALASASIYLPTRRACRLAREVFLQILGSDAAVLPRLVPIGDPDEDELAFAEAAAGPLAPTALDLPQKLGELERRLLLTRLILQWARSPDLRTEGHAPLVANSPGAALSLADALARLMDDMTTRNVPWERLQGLVPDHVDAYWQLTLKFLDIARDVWPAVLAERGVIEPAARRDQLIAAEALRLAATDRPVIAAGSTASMPATASLLAAIAASPHGAVVLPGLDTDLDDSAWELIGGACDAAGRTVLAPAAGHPQFALRAFLARLGMRRDEVVPLVSPAPHGRERLVSEALRPAAATERWRERLVADASGAALGDVAVIEAANAEEEALAVAVALREAVDRAGTTAALVTSDRGLARRVIAALARWDVAVEDSAGDALADTPAGVFARLAAEAALGGLAPVTLLGLLKHPLLRLDTREGGHARATRIIERALLRGPRPQPGSEGLARALETFRGHRPNLHRSDPRARISDAELAQAAELTARLHAALAPLATLSGAPRPVSEIAVCHREVLAALARDDGRGSELFSTVDGIELGEALDAIAGSPAAAALSIAPAEYGEFFHAAVAGRVVRRPPSGQARVHVFGLLEARLQTVDRVVLGGLVEGTWPPQTRSDPWLSRPMRHELGLDLPERRIGLTAHDFAQALGAREAVLSRAAKIAGTPTVASRFLQRLRAVSGQAPWRDACARGGRYVELARNLDRPARVKPVRQPEPRPPRVARPDRLTVTEIEHWLRDPYTIYAKHVLRLARLDPLDTPPGARDRGTVIHAVVGNFTESFAEKLPADPVAELLQLGHKHFAPLIDYPEAKAFWWPRFLRIADWFAAWERKRRAATAEIHAEIRGEVEIALGARTFRLITRADRIERGPDGCCTILDYKTGQAPSAAQVRTGLAPQLTLEGAILRQGGFKGIESGACVAGFAYVLLKGGDPAGKECPIAWDDTTADAEADKALARLRGLALRFEDEATPYRSLVCPTWRARHGDYDHLARVKEWSATGGETDAEAPA